MSSVFYLGLLSSIIVGSLLASGFAHYRQQKTQRKRKLIQQLRRSADHFAQISSSIANLSTNRSMAAELIGMAIHNYQRILRLEANSEHIQMSLKTAQEFAQSLSSSGIQPTSESNFTTTSEIFRIKQQLTDAENIFRKMVSRKDMAQETYAEYHSELMWLYLSVEVDSLVQQGDLAKTRKDKVNSLSLYQTAHNLLKKSSLSDPRKQEKIQLVSNILTGNDPK